MKHILKLAFFILIFCSSIFSQEQSVNCRKFELTYSEITDSPNTVIKFEVTPKIELNSDRNKYIWSVRNGKIINGQGKSEILVLNDSKNRSEIDITVDVQIKDLSLRCKSELSSQYYVCRLPPTAIKFDSYETTTQQEEAERLKVLNQTLLNDPLSRAVIILKDNKNLPNNLARLDSILTKEKYAKSQISFNITDDTYLPTEIWIVPFGADFDECKNCLNIEAVNIESLKKIFQKSSTAKNQ